MTPSVKRRSKLQPADDTLELIFRLLGLETPTPFEAPCPA